MPSASKAKSVLFLSADLVGSTSYKQRKPGWQKIFLSFYREFPQALNTARRKFGEEGAGIAFQLWKAIGDELIFKVEVRSEAEISLAVRIWLDAVSTYEDDSLREVTLALKGGAFIATFPGPDSESSIPREPETEDSDESVVILNDKALSGQKTHTKYLYDFFGPSVDTGFRVVGLAKERYFTLTVEVAWAMAKHAHSYETTPGGHAQHHVRDFVFMGREPLKGVWKGQEYPIFAIDREFDTPVNTAFRALNGGPITAEMITHVCESCSATDGWPSAVYLPDSSYDAFKRVPTDAMHDLRESEAKVSVEDPTDDANAGESLGPDAPLG